MEREVFVQRFQEASARARDFAREFIEEPLPDAMQFRIWLNASYDGNPLHEDERVFPEDSAPERARGLSSCTTEEVVDVLWRDGMVPEWVNLSVIGEIGTATLIEVMACGRFTAREQLLYHHGQGCPPFHVLGPVLPVGFEQGQKFSIYHRSQCSNRGELVRTARHSGRVWSLELQGDDFDDEAVASLPVFECMHILELRGSPLTGGGLTGLSRHPKLRHLRIYRSHAELFAAGSLPRLPHLETLTIENLPGGPWGFGALTRCVTKLAWLSLTSDHTLVLDGSLSSPMADISLRAPRIEGNPLPKKCGSLRLELREGRDEDIKRLLAPVKTLTHLSLRGTPVSDDLVESLVRRWKLEYLDVVDTLVGEGCVQRIRARYPRLRTYPNPDAKRPKLGSES